MEDLQNNLIKLKLHYATVMFDTANAIANAIPSATRIEPKTNTVRL